MDFADKHQLTRWTATVSRTALLVGLLPINGPVASSSAEARAVYLLMVHLALAVVATSSSYPFWSRASFMWSSGKIIFRAVQWILLLLSAVIAVANEGSWTSVLVLTEFCVILLSFSVRQDATGSNSTSRLERTFAELNSPILAARREMNKASGAYLSGVLSHSFKQHQDTWSWAFAASLRKSFENVLEVDKCELETCNIEAADPTNHCQIRPLSCNIECDVELTFTGELQLRAAKTVIASSICL